MLKDLSLLVRAGAMARHAAERHAVIAENIANADTPGFRARDLRPFDAALADAARAGDARAAARLSERFEIKGLDVAPNGNSVAIEDQMVRSVEAQAEHRAALSIYRKALELLRMSVQNRV